MQPLEAHSIVDLCVAVGLASAFGTWGARRGTLSRAQRAQLEALSAMLAKHLRPEDLERLERRLAAEVSPHVPKPCPPDCEECASIRGFDEDRRVDSALDAAARMRVKVDPEARRETVTETLRLTGQDSGSRPHRNDNRGRQPRRGARKPRYKDHR